MATSAHHISLMDQTALSISLCVKPNQNMIDDFDPTIYNLSIQPSIDSISLSALILAYSNSNYIKKSKEISFDVQGHHTTITKTNFCKLLALTPTANSVNLDLVPSTSILMACHLLTFHKSCCPPVSNALFTVLLKFFVRELLVMIMRGSIFTLSHFALWIICL